MHFKATRSREYRQGMQGCLIHSVMFSRIGRGFLWVFVRLRKDFVDCCLSVCPSGATVVFAGIGLHSRASDYNLKVVSIVNYLTSQ